MTSSTLWRLQYHQRSRQRMLRAQQIDPIFNEMVEASSCSIKDSNPCKDPAYCSRVQFVSFAGCYIFAKYPTLQLHTGLIIVDVAWKFVVAPIPC